MQKTITLSLLALLTVAIVADGCSDASRDEQAPPQKAEKKSLLERLVEVKEQIRNAPGRTGILTEEKRYSLNDEELIIRDFFRDRKGGFFVDVGCAWPIKASNTYYLEKHLGWTGIGFGDSMKPEKIEIPTIALDDLLDREGIGKIDLLSMDIEGHELKAVAGFDIERFQPDLAVIEGGNPAVRRYFYKHGYEQIQRYVPFDPINRYFRRKQAAAPAATPPSGVGPT